MKRINIAIDGFSGCGKSTLARDVASALGYRFIDTGALYRAITYLVLEWNGDDPIENTLAKMPKIEFSKDANRILINGVDREDEIRSARVADHVSYVASKPNVRKYLLDLQQSFIADKGVVMEGRDIGSVIMPKAELKLFISARTEVRAKRRYDQLKAKGLHETIEDVRQNLLSRDKADIEREMAPLKFVKNAIAIDNSDLSIEEQVKCVLALVGPLTHSHEVLGGLNVD